MKAVIAIGAFVALLGACEQSPKQVVESEGHADGISKSGQVVEAEGHATGRAKEGR